MDRAFAVFVFFIFIYGFQGAAGVARSASGIRTESLKKMDIHVRPEQLTTINISFVLTSLNKLETVSQELSTTFHLHMTWVDPRLAWDPQPGEPENLVFYVNELWTPPLVVSNAVNDAIVLLKDDIVPMRVSHKGTVTWIPRLSPTTTCDIDISKFPKDSQICHIHITSWVHSTSELDFLESPMGQYSEPANLDLSNKGIWKVVEVKVETQNIPGSTVTEYKNIQYTLHFKRNERFYWNLLIIPFWCLSLLMIPVFLVPSQYQPQKVAYSVSMLLSFQLYLKLLQSLVPPAIHAGTAHFFGEFVSAVMICGTIITGILVIQLVVVSCIGKYKIEEENRLESASCIGKYKIVKKILESKIGKFINKENVFNVTMTITFFILYLIGIVIFHIYFQ